MSAWLVRERRPLDGVVGALPRTAAPESRQARLDRARSEGNAGE